MVDGRDRRTSRDQDQAWGRRDRQKPGRGGQHDDDGINRRELILGGAGVAGAAGAGWLFFLRDDVPGAATPERAVEKLIEAMDEGDEEQYNAILHPDTPVSEANGSVLSLVSEADITLNNVTIVDQTDGRAEAIINITASGPRDTITEETRWELRKHSGGWFVYE